MSLPLVVISNLSPYFFGFILDIDHFKLMGMLETAKLMIHDDVTKKWEEQ